MFSNRNLNQYEQSWIIVWFFYYYFQYLHIPKLLHTICYDIESPIQINISIVYVFIMSPLHTNHIKCTNYVIYRWKSTQCDRNIGFLHRIFHRLVLKLDGTNDTFLAYLNSLCASPRHRTFWPGQIVRSTMKLPAANVHDGGRRYLTFLQTKLGGGGEHIVV